MRQVAVFWIAACAFLATSTGSCSRQTATPQVQEESSLASKKLGFQIPEAGPLVLMLGLDGQLGPVPGIADGQNPGQNPGQYPDPGQGPEPAPFAIQTAIAAVQAPVDGGAIIAINRTGLVYLVIQNHHVFLRWIEGMEAEFAGRSIAQAWTWDGKAMFLLHRNEIFEPEAMRTPAARVIAAKADGAIAFSGFESGMESTDHVERDLYGSPYALFPRASDNWLVQFRLAGPERTRTAFASWNPGENRLDQLDRISYEAAVRPAPMAEAPVALRLAAEALGGSMIIDAHMPDGSLQSWLWGSADTFLAVRALVSEPMVISLASDGQLVMVAANEIHKAHIDPPVPHSYFRDLAMLDGFVIAVWEEDLFPNLGRSGLVIMDATLLKAEPGQSPGQ